MAEETGLYWLTVEELFPHPDNPRLALREDVVASIQHQLAESGFDPAYALIVRPVEEGYQIISGHNRAEAAKRARLEQVPCWVRELDDEEAYMALVTSNSQGELSPLEIGFHALHCVGLSEGGRGKKGGFSEYAKKIGRKQNTISELVASAKVAENVSVERYLLIDKTQHLEISGDDQRP